jgi:hypothetical protein
MGGMFRILAFFMLAYFVLTIVKVVGEMFWPGSFKGRRKKGE